MSNTTNIPTGLNVQTQIPLDTIKFIQNESLLSNLGASNNLAFKYYDGLTIRCIDENTFYIWREVLSGEENTGLLSVDFTYPYNHSAFGINYSNKSFNFFRIKYLTESDIVNYTVNNIGDGVDLYKNTTGTNTKSFNFKKLKSDNLSIVDNGNDITINTPMTASIPALYVNNLYVPTYNEWLVENKIQNGGTAINGFIFRGKGTLAQPFTDSIVYPLAGGSSTITSNTSIQNSLNGDSSYSIPYSFVGNGSDISPQRIGQQIKVQDNVVGYYFIGNLNLNYVNIVLEENTIIYSDPVTGDFLTDYDTFSPTQALSMSINLKNGAKIVLNKSGFRNSGTSNATNNFLNYKQISISGNGIIVQNSTSIIANDYVIIESNYTTTNTFNNDGATQIIIDETVLSTNTQSIYKVGGNSKVNIVDSTLIINGITGLPASTEIFNQIGGVVRINNLNISVTPFFGTILNKVFPISKSATIPSELNMSNITLSGGMTTIIENESVLQPNVLVTNLRTIDFQCTNIIKSPSIIWTNCFLNNNVINSGVVDTAQVDLTIGNTVSSVNNFNGNIVENLRVFNNRASAISAGLPLYSAYIKTNGNVYPSTSTWVRDIVLPA